MGIAGQGTTRRNRQCQMCKGAGSTENRKGKRKPCRCKGVARAGTAATPTARNSAAAAGAVTVAAGADPADQRDAAVAAVLPESASAYYDQVNAKHFGGNAVGSVFTGATDVRDLLHETAAQRGSLEGDDRERLIQMGADADAFLPQCRYLLVETPGENGMASADRHP